MRDNRHNFRKGPARDFVNEWGEVDLVRVTLETGVRLPDAQADLLTVLKPRKAVGFRVLRRDKVAEDVRAVALGALSVHELLANIRIGQCAQEHLIHEVFKFRTVNNPRVQRGVDSLEHVAGVLTFGELVLHFVQRVAAIQIAFLDHRVRVTGIPVCVQCLHAVLDELVPLYSALEHVELGFLTRAEARPILAVAHQGEVQAELFRVLELLCDVRDSPLLLVVIQT